jgi:hypothetical protein
MKFKIFLLLSILSLSLTDNLRIIFHNTITIELKYHHEVLKHQPLRTILLLEYDNIVQSDQNVRLCFKVDEPFKNFLIQHKLAKENEFYISHMPQEDPGETANEKMFDKIKKPEELTTEHAIIYCTDIDPSLSNDKMTKFYLIKDDDKEVALVTLTHEIERLPTLLISSRREQLIPSSSLFNKLNGYIDGVTDIGLSVESIRGLYLGMDLNVDESKITNKDRKALTKIREKVESHFKESKYYYDDVDKVIKTAKLASFKVNQAIKGWLKGVKVLIDAELANDTPSVENVITKIVTGWQTYLIQYIIDPKIEAYLRPLFAALMTKFISDNFKKDFGKIYEILKLKDDDYVAVDTNDYSFNFRKKPSKKGHKKFINYLANNAKYIEAIKIYIDKTLIDPVKKLNNLYVKVASPTAKIRKSKI